MNVEQISLPLFEESKQKQSFHESEGVPLAPDPSPVFCTQASWLCYAPSPVSLPDQAEVAFIYLQTSCSQADKEKEAWGKLSLEERKKRSPDGKGKFKPSEEAEVILLTRIQCPYLAFDREGAFEEVFSSFMAVADAEAARIEGKAYAAGDSYITTAWRGETRAYIRNGKTS